MCKQLSFIILVGVFLLAGGNVCTQQYWTGNGGRGLSIAVLAPEGKGLTKDEAHFPIMVQGVLLQGLSSPFSAMTVLDRENMDKIIAEGETGIYADEKGFLQLGQIANVQYILNGTIQKTGSNFMLQLKIAETKSGASKAVYTGTWTLVDISNQNAAKKASLDLLEQMGITLTSAGRAALSRPADTAQIQGQTALSKGIEAARQGTEIAAQIYYFQAAALDPSLLEATRRSKVISANISSGNIGADTRNDIAWRKNWITRLTEFEETYYRMIKAGDPPYTLFYSTGIERGRIDYQSETIDLSIPINMRANSSWIASVAQAGNAVYTELSAALNATGRKNDWGLGSWPRSGVTGTNPFTSWPYDFSIVFELVNEQNRVIGRRTINMRRSFSVSRDNDRVVTDRTENSFDTVSFNAVKANDISDNLTIRIASVNGADPKNTRFPMTALSAAKWDEYRKNTDTFRIENGIIKGFSSNRIQNLVLPAEIWGEPITSVGDSAFKNNQLTSVVISDCVTSIGAEAFANSSLTSVVIPDSVTSIDAYAFHKDCKGIGSGHDFYNDKKTWIITSITIGANVAIFWNSFGHTGSYYIPNSKGTGGTSVITGIEDYSFGEYYNRNGKKAGIYTAYVGWAGAIKWRYSPR